MALTSKQREERLALLSELELFSGLDSTALEELVELTRVVRLEERDELCHKGDKGGDFYAVLSGRLKALSSSEEGREALFVLLGPGEVIGEISLLDAGPRSMTIVAAIESELLVIGRRDFLAFLRRHSEVALNLAQVLAGRVRRLSETVEDAYFRNLPARLAKTFLALARSAGQETADGVQLDVRLSQQDLADFVGKTREAVNKQIRTWTQQEVVAMRDGKLVLRDLEALEQLASPIRF